MADDFLKNTVDRVGGMIDDAVRTGDFDDLSYQIGGLMREVVDTVTRSGAAAAKKATENLDPYVSPGQAAARQAAARKAAQREAMRQAAADRRAGEARADQYFMRPPSLTGAKIMTVLGGAGTVLFGLAALMMAVFAAFSNGIFTSISQPLAGLCGIFTAVSVAMLVAGRRATVRTKRFKAYRMKLLPRLYADVDEMAREMNLPEKTVISDLESFTKKGMIRQGHFDDGKTCFIASDELYRQYRSTVTREKETKRAQAAETEAQTAAREAAARQEAAYSPEVREILRKGGEYIEMIRHANDEIPNEEITAKLNRTEDIVRRIFDEVRIRPVLAKNLNMFMNYYLPTTTKLVSAYEEMDKQPVQGENIRNAKHEIGSSLDTINNAFETLLDSFFREQAMDVSSDLNVMKMMMKQEGLTPDDLTAMRRRQAAKTAKTTQAAGASAQAQTQTAQTAQAAGASAQAAQAQTAQAAQAAEEAQSAQEQQEF